MHAAIVDWVRCRSYWLLFIAVGLIGALMLIRDALDANAQIAQRAFRPQRVLGPLPPITKVPVKSVREAHDSLNPAELVIGVTLGKQSRAYSINMLTGPQREILNDTLDGTAIAATW